LRRWIDQDVLHDPKRPLVDLYVFVEGLEVIVLALGILRTPREESRL